MEVAIRVPQREEERGGVLFLGRLFVVGFGGWGWGKGGFYACLVVLRIVYDLIEWRK